MPITPSAISSPVLWVIFDAVGTLLQPRVSVAETYWQAGHRWGSRLILDEVRDRFRRAFVESETTCFPPDRRGCTSEAEEHARWRWIVQECLPDLTQPDRCFEDLWQYFADPRHWVCFEDVGPTLLALQHRNLQLGVASNFDSRLNLLLESFSELAPLRHRWISSAVGFRKPDSRFYQTILQQVDCPPSKIVFVGDDVRLDAQEPTRHGLCGIHIHRQAENPGPGVIRRLTELLSLVGECRDDE